VGILLLNARRSRRMDISAEGARQTRSVNTRGKMLPVGEQQRTRGQRLQQKGSAGSTSLLALLRDNGMSADEPTSALVVDVGARAAGNAPPCTAHIITRQRRALARRGEW